MDQIFALGLIAKVTRSMPPGLAQQVEAFVQAQGFDALLLGFVIEPLAMRQLHMATASALHAAQTRPDELLKARHLVYSTLKLDMGKKP